MGVRIPRRLRTARRPPRAWRPATPVVLAVCGGLFVVSAVDSQGTDLRPGRYTDLAALVRADSRQVQQLTDRASALQAEVARLSERFEDARAGRLRGRIRRLEDPAGLSPVSGPGVTVVLSDAPDDVRATSTRDPNLLVVHQQDLQAVVNALWQGGAEAVTLQGKRLVTTTGIKCEGNAVTLHGVPYPQPYVVSAVGDPMRLLGSVLRDDYLRVYREQARLPDVGVGWEARIERRVVAPAYDGLLDLQYATPLA